MTEADGKVVVQNIKSVKEFNTMLKKDKKKYEKSCKKQKSQVMY